jgi:hypothetical protein
MIAIGVSILRSLKENRREKTFGFVPFSAHSSTPIKSGSTPITTIDRGQPR